MRPSPPVAATLALLAFGCSATSADPAATEPKAEVPEPRIQVVHHPIQGFTPHPTSTLAPQAVAAAPDPTRDATVLVRALGTTLVVREDPSPDAPADTVEARNPWSQALRFPVLDRARDVNDDRWLRIRLPVRPNGSTGWVRASDVRLERVRERIEVDLSTHTLRHLRRGEIVTELRVATGSPSTPTPAGNYFVWAQVSYEDPGGPYGTYALGLSGFSRVLLDWPGGGRLAIHGTDDPTDPGRDVSHGCVRVFDPQLGVLHGIPLGTPVRIHP